MRIDACEQRLNLLGQRSRRCKQLIFKPVDTVSCACTCVHVRAHVCLVTMATAYKHLCACMRMLAANYTRCAGALQQRPKSLWFATQYRHCYGQKGACVSIRLLLAFCTAQQHLRSHQFLLQPLDVLLRPVCLLRLSGLLVSWCCLFCRRTLHKLPSLVALPAVPTARCFQARNC